MAVDSLITLPHTVYGAGWLNQQEIVYSKRVGNRWQLVRYNVHTGISNEFDKKWAFALASSQQQVFVDQTMTVFQGGSAELTMLECKFPLHRQGLTMRLDGSDFYCLSRDNSSELLRLVEMTTLQRQAHKMRSMGYFDYAVSGDLQALSKTKYAASDIFRTNF